MLQKIKLTNFKCFESLELACAPLTLLCGLNGMGKSSVLQALLVLRQSTVSGELDQGRLLLSGELAEVGTGQEVLFEGAETEVVAFELNDSEASQPLWLAFDYAREADQLNVRLAGVSDSLVSPNVAGSQWQGIPPLGGEWRNIAPLGGRVIYLNAERLGPRKFYDRSEVFARHGNLGTRGEYTWNYLYARQNETMENTDPRCLEPFAGRRLLDVVDRWLQEITPGVHVGLEETQAADAVIAGFSFDHPGDVASRQCRATNVGFGLSYTLSVVMALLAPAGLSAKIPLLNQVGEDVESRFLGCEEWTLSEGDGEPLVFCAITDGVAVGFPSSPEWDRDRVTVHFNELLPDETIEPTSEEIDQLTRSAHAASICDRHRARLHASSDDPVALWENREAAFPYLSFGPGVQDGLRGFAHLLPAIVGKLVELDRSARHWRERGGPAPVWRTKVTPESQPVMNNPKLREARRFPSYRGTRELFEWHARFGNNGRVHLRFDPITREIEVGYIGKHLPL